jgi:hypothetical protein
MRPAKSLFVAAFCSFLAANLIHNRWGVDSALIPGLVFGALYFRRPTRLTAFLAALGVSGPALAFFRWEALVPREDAWYAVNHAFLLLAGVLGIAAAFAAIRPKSIELHRVANIGVIAGSAAQFYAVGLVMFGVNGMDAHRLVGSILIVTGLFSWLFAQAAGRAHARPAAAFILFTLLFLQPALAFGLRRVAPAAAALHALNGLAIIALAVWIEFGHRRAVSAAVPPVPLPQPAVSPPF